jgi:protein-disulfide isomerase
MPPSPAIASVTDKDHIRGPAHAPVTLVEYGDYECPDCLASEPIVTALLEKTDGRVRAVFRHFPRNSIHPRASVAAASAEAAAMQGKFWEMHAALFKHQKNLADTDLTHLAMSLGLDVYRFARDVESHAVQDRVAADHDVATRLGLKRTPTFFIDGVRHDGPATLEGLLAAVGGQGRSLE